MHTFKFQQRKLRGGLSLVCASLFLGAYHFGEAGRLDLVTASLEDGVQVSEKIWIVPNPRAGNIALHFGEDGLLMIDDQFMADVKNTEAAIAAQAGDAPTYLINTHWHGDHTGANQHFGSSATIFAHENVRRRLADAKGVEGSTAKDTPKLALPEVTYAEGLSIHFNDEELSLVHLPRAHTDGDTVVWFKGSNVVHMGDTFFASGYPFIDVDSGGNAFGLIAGLRSVLEWIPKDAKVIPGHGTLQTVESLQSYIIMLETITGRIQELAAEDFSLQEILDAKVSEEYDAIWGGGFINPEALAGSIFASLPK